VQAKKENAESKDAEDQDGRRDNHEHVGLTGCRDKQWQMLSRRSMLLSHDTPSSMKPKDKAISEGKGRKGWTKAQHHT
jgi:hypothetical protein